MGDLLGDILGKMDSGNSARPSDQRRPTTSSTPSTTGSNVWTRNPPGASNARVFPTTAKKDSGTPIPPAAPTSFVSSFGRIPKREFKSEQQEPMAKRRPFDSQTAKGSFNHYSTVPVQLNMYKLDISKMAKKLNRILFKVFLVQNDGNEFELNDGVFVVGGDVNRQNRRRAQFVLFQNWFKLNSHFFNGKTNSNVAAYDCADTFYIGSSDYSGGIEEHTCEMRKDDFSNKDWFIVTRLSRRKNPTFRIRIKAIGEVYTQGQEALSANNRPELTRVVETITNQILNDGNFLLYSSGVYPSNDRSLSQPDSVTEIRGGFSKTVKIIEKDGVLDVSLTIDTASSPFFKSTQLMDFVVSKYNDVAGGGSHGQERQRNNHGGGGWRDRQNNFDDRRGHHRDNDRENSPVNSFSDKFLKNEITERQLADIGRSMKGLVVEAKHLESSEANRSITIDGLKNASARTMSFDWEHDGIVETVTVEEYFRKRYSWKLRYPDVPLVLSNRRKSSDMFPMELLFIMPGQRLKLSQISVNIQSHMTGKNATLPSHHVDQHKHIIQKYLKLDDNQFLTAFKITLPSKSPVTAMAKILAPPLIKFSHKVYQPEPKSVRFTTNSKFVKPAVIRSIAIMLTDRRVIEDLGKFKTQLVHHCRDQGIRIEQSADDWKTDVVSGHDIVKVKEFMTHCLKEKVTLVLAVCPEKRPDVHDVLKYFEEKMGMLTMQICKETGQKLSESGGNRQTIDNILRKLNVKCGGTNFYIDIPESVKNVSICSKVEEMRRKLFANTQFVGLEMSHTGARTQYDIQNGIFEGDPTVVGISYSLGCSTQLGGFFYYQPTRETQIKKLDKEFPKVFQAYKKVKGSLPETIVIYRTGASEGDYPRVLEELANIRESFAVVPGYNPKLVVLLAQRHSHVRVFPVKIEGKRAQEQNVQSGTVLDNVQSSTGATEFILVSQSALIGTVRPTRYTIASNTAIWSKDEIYNVTYMLAFGHQVSYQPPAVPDVLYGAQNLAKRGHNNYKTHMKIGKIQEQIKDLFAQKQLEGTGANENDYLDLVVEKISNSLNLMTIEARNFWA